MAAFRKVHSWLLHKRLEQESGQALLEFALVVPLLLLLMLGIISYGLFINANVSLQQSVRVGARTASLGDPLGPTAAIGPTVIGVITQQLGQSPGLAGNEQKMQADVTCLMSSTATTPSHYTYDNSNGTWSSNGTVVSGAAATSCNSPSVGSSLVTVSVSEPYQPIVPIPGLLPANLTLRQNYTMMVEK